MVLEPGKLGRFKPKATARRWRGVGLGLLRLALPRALGLPRGLLRLGFSCRHRGQRLVVGKRRVHNTVLSQDGLHVLARPHVAGQRRRRSPKLNPLWAGRWLREAIGRRLHWPVAILAHCLDLPRSMRPARGWRVRLPTHGKPDRLRCKPCAQDEPYAPTGTARSYRVADRLASAGSRRHEDAHSCSFASSEPDCANFHTRRSRTVRALSGPKLRW